LQQLLAEGAVLLNQALLLSQNGLQTALKLALKDLGQLLQQRLYSREFLAGGTQLLLELFLPPVALIPMKNRLRCRSPLGKGRRWRRN
jgi:hypothetical protein